MDVVDENQTLAPTMPSNLPSGQPKPAVILPQREQGLHPIIWITGIVIVVSGLLWYFTT